MKIKTKNKKMKLTFLIILAALSCFAVYVSATGWDSKKASHDILYADTITGKSGGLVTINDSFYMPFGGFGIWASPDGNIKLKIGGEGTIKPEILIEDDYPAILFNDTDSNDNDWLVYSNYSKFHISQYVGDANLTTRLTIDKNGSVGIGTENPMERLTVEGNFLQTASSAKLISSYSPSSAWAVYVSGEYAYLGIEGGPKLEIIDVSMRSNPQKIGEIVTAATPTGIYVLGNYAFITEQTGYLEIVDISNPTHPTIVSGNTVAPSSGDIYVSGKYAYIAGGSGGLVIMDISNPASPQTVGQLDTPSPYFTTAVYVSGNYAYITEGNGGGLATIDISNPTSPIEIGREGSSNLMGVYVSGKYAYTADTAIGFRIMDISNPSDPVQVSQGNNIRGKDIFVSGKYAYLVDEASIAPIYYPFGLTIIDISNPNNPQIASQSVIGWSGDIYISGKYAYISNAAGLKIIDISGIDSPSASIGSISASTLDVSENAQIGNNLYVGTALNVGSGGIKSDGTVNGRSLESISVIKLIKTTTPGSCDGNRTGMLHYNSALKEPCYCSGAGNWKQFDGAGNC